MDKTEISHLLGRDLNEAESVHAVPVYCRGVIDIPLGRKFSVIGSRRASKAGILRALQIGKKLAESKIITIGGLAKGIDTAAHRSAIGCGGRTIAVLGTPMNVAYPRENSDLQYRISREHLAVSQYDIGHDTVPADFATRNRTMALLSDSTVIVEASEPGGTIHHARESLRLGRPLYICREEAEKPWAQRLAGLGAQFLDDVADII